MCPRLALRGALEPSAVFFVERMVCVLIKCRPALLSLLCKRGNTCVRRTQQPARRRKNQNQNILEQKKPTKQQQPTLLSPPLSLSMRSLSLNSLPLSPYPILLHLLSSTALSLTRSHLTKLHLHVFHSTALNVFNPVPVSNRQGPVSNKGVDWLI